MEARADFLVSYATQHAPVTVRQLYYQAEVMNLPGIRKDEASYSKVQRQVLSLRREARLPYNCIADATRWMRKPRTYHGLEDLQRNVAMTYRRALWAEQDVSVEIWLEKDALAGVVYPVTQEYDVPLMVTRGQASETFAHNSILAYAGTGKPLYVFAFYDFDQSGQAAGAALREKMERFGAEMDVEVHFEMTMLDDGWVQRLDLPTRPHKRSTPADRNWPYPYACELDAVPPDMLREVVRLVIEEHMPAGELARLREVEELERAAIRAVSFAEARK